MQNTPKFSGAQPPVLPRAILAAALLPYFIDAPLSAREITIERLVFETEVQATRPSHILALAGALAALGGAS